MKADIHPQYYAEAKVICACGNTWITGATQEVVRTDICSKCHPFFTGEQRIVDTAGQVERFTRRVEKGREISDELAAKAAARKPVKEIEVILDEDEEEVVAEAAEPKKAEPVKAPSRIARKVEAKEEEPAEVAVEVTEPEKPEPAVAKKEEAVEEKKTFGMEDVDLVEAEVERLTGEKLEVELEDADRIEADVDELLYRLGKKAKY